MLEIVANQVDGRRELLFLAAAGSDITRAAGIQVAIETGKIAARDLDPHSLALLKERSERPSDVHSDFSANRHGSGSSLYSHRQESMKECAIALEGNP
jgi:hypothetical protein